MGGRVIVCLKGVGGEEVKNLSIPRLNDYRSSSTQ